MPRPLSLALIALLSSNSLQSSTASTLTAKTASGCPTVKGGFGNFAACRPAAPSAKPCPCAPPARCACEDDEEPAQCCPLAEELEEIESQLGSIETELVAIKSEQTAQSGQLAQAVAGVASEATQISTVSALLGQITEQLNNRTQTSVGSAGGASGETIVNINVAGCCSCSAETNSTLPVEPPVGETPTPEPVNVCLTPDNQLEASKAYTFSQGYPSGGCDNDFLLWSPAVNFADAKLAGSYHGKLADESDRTKFGAGVALIQRVNKALEGGFQWGFDTSLPASLLSAHGVEVGGGQLTNAGMCLGYTNTENYPALKAGEPVPADGDADHETRLQLVKCLTAADASSFPSAEAFIAKAKTQLWTADAVESSSYKVMLRNVCTDFVIKKISDCDSEKHSVLTGQKCKNKLFHFDAELVHKSDCEAPDMYNVNHCLWDYSPVV